MLIDVESEICFGQFGGILQGVDNANENYFHGISNFTKDSWGGTIYARSDMSYAAKTVPGEWKIIKGVTGCDLHLTSLKILFRL